MRTLPVVVVSLIIAFAALATGCAEGPTITEGTITFDPQPAALTGTELTITILQDPQGARTVIQTIEQEVEDEVSQVHFELTGDEPPAGDYVMNVHLDLDGDGTVNAGDYTSGDVPVFLGVYPETVNATLTPM